MKRIVFSKFKVYESQEDVQNDLGTVAQLSMARYLLDRQTPDQTYSITVSDEDFAILSEEYHLTD